MAKMTEEEMFTAIVKAVDSGKVAIDKLPASEELKQKVRVFIAARDSN